tara:strand:- start:131 stop:739 length:609 start_codon:yes stop_codon:yes gene_type:complete
MAPKLKVIVPPHPLIGHWLSILRDISTPPALYAKGFEEIGRWLSYEAIRDWIPNKKEKIQTDKGEAEGLIIEGNIKLIAITSIPGGLELWNGGREVIPNAHLSLGGVPEDLNNNVGVIIYLDQIATGQNLLRILRSLKKQKIDPRQIRVITALTSNFGLKRVSEENSDLTIYTTCIDEKLSEKGDLSPGIGNPLLRLNTTIC